MPTPARPAALADASRLLVPGERAALVPVADGFAVATQRGTAQVEADTVGTATAVRRLDEAGPRWVWWSARSTAAPLLAADPTLRLRRCWDLAAVHRLLCGGWADDPGRVWAAVAGLPEDCVPRAGQLDLLGPQQDDGGDAERPVRPDGHVRAEWAAGGWRAGLDRAAAWAELALEAARRQHSMLSAAPAGSGTPRRRGDPVATAWAESAAELLAAELEATGLPVDVSAAERVLASFAGPRPRDGADSARLRAVRDGAVLRYVPGRSAVDLRSPGQVKALLADLGIDVPDTRSWRLERMASAHPVVPALLEWRQAERFVTTYGYRWLDEHVGPDGRLRGTWSGSDGGAGRMTAQAGLHSMPKELRVAVRAEPGMALVRADLGQVEPRVLAVVSGDEGLAAAAREDDLYAPVADRLGCERAVAKVAVLAAMYGQTSGTAGEALRGMERAYPVALAYLEDAQRRGEQGLDVRTFGGRRVRTGRVEPPVPEATDPADEHAGEQVVRTYRAAVAARGRFARNAVVQGAAAELFKAWAATVRARLAARGTDGGRRSSGARQPPGEMVLCLHDELVLQVGAACADEVATGVQEDLARTAARWSRLRGGGPAVRFVADVSVRDCWGEP
ncbi:MAG: DNA polymerase [Actinomycetes bacterium]